MVRVTVVVPVYNPGEHIEGLLESLLGQSLPAGEYELLFVDDGSTDGTPDRLAALARSRPNVRLERIPRSGWPGRPRNVGIDLARGEYVFFADHDDRLGLEALERMHRLAVLDDADVVIGKVVGHGKGVPRDVFRENRHGLTAREVPFSLLAPHKLFRRALLEDPPLRFPEGRVRLEDHAFVVPAYFRARRISILADYPCYHWIRRPDAGNASLRRPDMAAYFGNVAEVLDLVDAHTEPGPHRDRLYLRWYRGKLLAQVGHARFERWDDRRRRETVHAARALVLERFPPRLDAKLSYAHRIRAALLRRDDLEGLRALSRYVGRLRAGVRVVDVRGDGTWLTLRLAGRLRARDRPDPLQIAGERFLAPDDLGRHLTEDELEVTGLLRDTGSGVYLKSRQDGAEWDLPTEPSIARHAAGPGTERAQVTLRVRVAPTVAAAGAPLPPGEYELRAVVSIAGFIATTPVRHDGEPFLLRVDAAHRLHHWHAPAPPVPVRRIPLRPRLARAARRVPGLVPAI